MKTVKEKMEAGTAALMQQFGYKNRFAVPRIEKVIVGTGTGSTKDREKAKLIPDRLGKITGQKPVPRAAKKSIASFKLRQGDVVGHSVTLRGKRMLDFLDRLINIAIPRQRDFRGIVRTAVDQMGNLSIGVKEHTIFPETADEDVRNVFGLAITIVTSARSQKEALALFEHIGIPFKK